MADEDANRQSGSQDAPLRRFIDPDFLDFYGQIEVTRRDAVDRAADLPTYSAAALLALLERPRELPSAPDDTTEVPAETDPRDATDGTANAALDRAEPAVEGPSSVVIESYSPQLVDDSRLEPASFTGLTPNLLGESDAPSFAPSSPPSSPGEVDAAPLSISGHDEAAAPNGPDSATTGVQLPPWSPAARVNDEPFRKTVVPEGAPPTTRMGPDTASHVAPAQDHPLGASLVDASDASHQIARLQADEQSSGSRLSEHLDDGLTAAPPDNVLGRRKEDGHAGTPADNQPSTEVDPVGGTANGPGGREPTLHSAMSATASIYAGPGSAHLGEFLAAPGASVPPEIQNALAYPRDFLEEPAVAIAAGTSLLSEEEHGGTPTPGRLPDSTELEQDNLGNDWLLPAVEMTQSSGDESETAPINESPASLELPTRAPRSPDRPLSINTDAGSAEFAGSDLEINETTPVPPTTPLARFSDAAMTGDEHRPLLGETTISGENGGGRDGFRDTVERDARGVRTFFIEVQRDEASNGPPVWEEFSRVLDRTIPSPASPPAAESRAPTFDLGTSEEQRESLERRKALPRDERELPGIVFPPGPANLAPPRPERDLPGIEFPPGPANLAPPRPERDLPGIEFPPGPATFRPPEPTRPVLGIALPSGPKNPTKPNPQSPAPSRREADEPTPAIPSPSLADGPSLAPPRLIRPRPPRQARTVGPAKRRDRRPEILARLSTGPASAHELAVEFEISREGVLRWLRQLEADGTIRSTAVARTSRVNKWILVDRSGTGDLTNG